jgi:hypothetical protein
MYGEPILDTDEVNISGTCYTTYPCQHRLTYNGETKLMGAREIYKLLRQLQIPIPEHFQYVASDIRRQTLRSAINNNDYSQILLADEKDFTQDMLQNACKYSDINVVKYLIEKRNMKINGSCLEQACERKDDFIFKYLYVRMKETDPEMPCNLATCLANVCKTGNLGLMKTFIDMGENGSRNSGLLAIALQNKHQDIIDYLLEQSKINKIKYSGWELQYAISNKDLKTVKYLIENDLLENKIYMCCCAKRKVKDMDRDIKKYLSQYC